MRHEPLVRHEPKDHAAGHHCDREDHHDKRENGIRIVCHARRVHCVFVFEMRGCGTDDKSDDDNQRYRKHGMTRAEIAAVRLIASGVPVAAEARYCRPERHDAVPRAEKNRIDDESRQRHSEAAVQSRCAYGYDEVYRRNAKEPVKCGIPAAGSFLGLMLLLLFHGTITSQNNCRKLSAPRGALLKTKYRYAPDRSPHAASSEIKIHRRRKSAGCIAG